MQENRRSYLTRLRERVRYGLLAQEALDRLARAGLIYCPYFLVKERALEEPGVGAELSELTFTKLGAGEAMLIAGLQCRPLPVAQVQQRLQRAACYGVFYRNELAGYSWMDFVGVRPPYSSTALFDLGEFGAYLFDMYVARAHRGRRLAPWLRYRVYQSIMSHGRTEMYSITVAHNESSRRFKARLGAIEIEKRLVVGLRGGNMIDRRLKALTTESLPTPRSIRVRGDHVGK